MILRVKKIIPQRNYGFLVNDATGEEIFLHRDDFSGFWDDLEKDANDKTPKVIHIECDINANNPKGPRAENASRKDWPNQGR